MIGQTIAVAFSMFSALPMPQFQWNERNMAYALCAFPLVGVVVGALWWGAGALCAAWNAPILLQAAVLCLIPVLVSGGIHLDGYADTSDAMASNAGQARRQEILKDSHCGAFAIIRLCAYFVASFALCGSVRVAGRDALWMGLIFVLSRALSGLSIASFPLARDTGLAHSFATAAHRRRVRTVLTAAVLLLSVTMAGLGGLAGLGAVLAALGCFWYYHHTAMVKFGGLSGDLAGWFLQKAELWMLAAVVCVQWLGRTPA